MIIAIVVLAIVIIAGGLVSTIWFIWYRRRLTRGEKITAEGGLPFRWSYIIAPLAILLLSIILSAYFFHLLPAQVAVHFELDGTPDRWLSREMTIVGMLLPQLLLVLLAGGVVWGVIKLGLLPGQTGSSGIKGERIVSFMGNFVALPQLIVFFAMLDILSYNSYQRHILPMWIFLLIILGLLTVALGVFLVFILFRAGRAMSQPKE